MTNTIQIDAVSTLVAGCIVLLVGRFVNKRLPILSKYHIPIPITGGLIAAAAITCLYYFANLQLDFDNNLANTFVLLFFASLGLAADFKKLFAGGKAMVLLLLSTIIIVGLQDIIGPLMAKLLGLNPLYGVLAGSVTLVGGHSTGGAWGPIFESAGVDNAKEIAFTCATVGLVAGGLLGGPVAQYLIKSKKLSPNASDNQHEDYEDNEKIKPIRVSSVTEGFICLAVTMYLGVKLQEFMKSMNWDLGFPTFVWVIFTGIVIRSLITDIFKQELREVTIDVLGNVLLSLFLAISLLSIQLWAIADLALPVTGILLVQFIVVVTFVVFISYYINGSNYDSAVICAGQVGFSFGATPTAIANMQSVTNHFGPSHKAFLIIPLVGSFFLDIVNAFVIKMSLSIW